MLPPSCLHPYLRCWWWLVYDANAVARTPPSAACMLIRTQKASSMQYHTLVPADLSWTLRLLEPIQDVRLYFKIRLIFYLTKFPNYVLSIFWLHEFHEWLNEHSRKSHEVDKDRNIVSIISRIDTSGKESLILMLTVDCEWLSTLKTKGYHCAALPLLAFVILISRTLSIME